MATRGSVGSWLEGTPGGDGDGSPRGAGLGLPEEGSGSLARVPRRLVALAVDWLACMAVSAVLFPAVADGFFLQRGAPMATLAVFVVENVVLIGTIGNTLGHRLLGMRVIPVMVRDGGGVPVPGAPGLFRALVRTVLLCLVLPAVVWDGDGRGLHDRAAGTALVRR